MHKQNVTIGLAILFTLGVILFSFLYQPKIPEQGTGVAQEQVNKAVTNEQPVQSTPSRPEDFGIVVFSENNRPQTQAEYDGFASEQMRKLKEKAPPEALQAMKAGIQDDNAAIEKKLKQLDENINECQALLKQQPNDEDTKKRMDRLMMLKSMTKELVKLKQELPDKED
jgi:hypothetical protein